MTERDLAMNICNVHARTIVDDNGGVTLGGNTLAEKYAEVYNKAGGYNPQEIESNTQALRHWVESAGYNADGKFEVKISNHIINCYEE